MTVELPAGPEPFVNRDEEQAQAARWVLDGVRRGRLAVVALSGPTGVGKRALACRIAANAHQEGGFAHVLHVDLDVYRRADRSLDGADVLAQLLVSLGVRPDEDRSAARLLAQYRAVTSEVRVVLVLDNARYGSEVAELLPSSAGAVIVTSDRPLHDLHGGAGKDLPVRPLRDGASRELIEAIVPDGRLAADPEATEALLRLCEGSPTALRIAACTVRRHGLRPLSRLLDDVRGALDEQVAPVVDRVLDIGYGELSARGAELYRLLPAHPGPTFTVASATALLGQGADACAAGLEELHAAGLADLRDAFRDPGARLRLSQAQRAHALRTADTGAAPGERAAAQRRALEWVTRQWQRSDELVAGRRLRVGPVVGEIPDAPDVPFAGPATATTDAERAERLRRLVRWQFADRHVMSASVRLAHATGEYGLCVALCECAWTYFQDHPPTADGLELLGLGAESAARAEDLRWIVRMRCQLARWLWESDVPAAEQELAVAVAAAGRLGDGPEDTRLRASAIEFQGMLAARKGDLTAAARRFAESRGLQESIGNGYGAMLQDYRLGETLARAGRLAEAEELLVRAHGKAAELERERMTARTGFALGGVLSEVGRRDEARALYAASLDSARRREAEFDEARVHDALAALEARAGDAEQAARHTAAALAIRERNGLV